MAFRDSRASLGRMSTGRLSQRKFDSVIEGNMEKLSSKKKWQKRYFVLTEIALVYYDNNKKSSKVREVMTLDSVSKVEMIEVGTTKQKAYEVQITCGNNFPYPLRTSSREEADQWLDALLNTLQDGKRERSSQGAMQTQQDMMMQVAMAMNMGLQMGMQNNADQNSLLAASIHQSTMANRQAMHGELLGQGQQGSGSDSGSSSDSDDPTSHMAHAIVNGAIDDVDRAIDSGSNKAMSAVENAMQEHNKILHNALDDSAGVEQISPAELAEDAGVDLTTSFANFYNDAFGEFTEEALDEESSGNNKHQPIEGEDPAQTAP